MLLKFKITIGTKYEEEKHEEDSFAIIYTIIIKVYKSCVSGSKLLNSTRYEWQIKELETSSSHCRTVGGDPVCEVYGLE